MHPKHPRGAVNPRARGGAFWLKESAKIQPIVPPSQAARTFYEAAEVMTHNTLKDAWVTYNGLVYDISRYSEFHPGGLPCLKNFFGYDITKIVSSVHGWINIPTMLQPLIIGKLRGPAPQRPTQVRRQMEHGVLRGPPE